jgi:hypothetical protein
MARRVGWENAFSNSAAARGSKDTGMVWSHSSIRFFEYHKACERLVQAPIVDDDKLRSLRAVEILESIATLAAIDILQTLATGAEGGSVTRQARAALRRLAHF